MPPNIKRYLKNREERWNGEFLKMKTEIFLLSSFTSSLHLIFESFIEWSSRNSVVFCILFLNSFIWGIQLENYTYDFKTPVSHSFQIWDATLGIMSSPIKFSHLPLLGLSSPSLLLGYKGISVSPVDEGT